MKMAMQQRGMSFISAMIMMVLFGFLAIFIIKLVPPYIEYFNIRTVMESFKSDPTPYANVVAIQKALDKRLRVNDIKSITAEDVVIEPDEGGYALSVEYETRVPFVSNVSLVVKFTGQGEARGISGAP